MHQQIQDDEVLGLNQHAGRIAQNRRQFGTPALIQSRVGPLQDFTVQLLRSGDRHDQAQGHFYQAEQALDKNGDEIGDMGERLFVAGQGGSS